MVLGFSVSGSTVAVHTGDLGSNPTWNNFLFSNFLMHSILVKVTNTELWDINQLMGYRDALWYIKYMYIDML